MSPDTQIGTLDVICAFYLGLTSTEQGKEDSAKKADADPEGLQLAQTAVCRTA